MRRGNYTIRGERPAAKAGSKVMLWLKERGVKQRAAEAFLRDSGCETVQDLAVYLRVKLAPLDYANVDSINWEMRDMLGVNGSQAFQIISDIDLPNAINQDIGEEATTYIQASGLLSAPFGTGNVPGLSPAAGGLEVSDRVSVGGLTPRMSQFGAVAPAPVVPQAQLQNVFELGETPEDADISGPSLHHSGLHHSGVTADSASKHISHSGSHPTSKKDNGFGSFMFTPPLRTVGIGNPAAAAIQENPGASGPLGTPRSEALTMDFQPGTASFRQQKGMPTLSHKVEPGPYHKANARLRKQLPHYRARVNIRTRWDHVLITVLTFCTFTAYVGMRVWYLVTGKAEEFRLQNISLKYSWVVLAAEVVLGLLLFYSNQLFWKQEIVFTIMDEEEVQQMTQDVLSSGVAQTVHVLIATYSESADMVKESILRLLMAPEPVYMEKNIYVCDDGHSKREGPKKRDMVEQLRILGHTNVHYVGDRVRKESQLNGKSAKLNYVIFNKLYPLVTVAEEVPDKDIIMVMDCDHMVRSCGHVVMFHPRALVVHLKDSSSYGMLERSTKVKPEIFNMMAPCMRDPKVGVTLSPQTFHNLIHPDWTDSANADFNLAKMPYSFGAGNSFITGTNVMIRARAAFQVCRYAEMNAQTDVTRPLDQAQTDNRQIYAEDEISEDVELGARMHAYGYKSVIVGERLASGEVPLNPRAMWRQRLRWMKGGHTYVMAGNSIFRKKSEHMSFYQKSLYWVCPVSHFSQLLSEPVMFTLPFFCLVMKQCPYGMDIWLFWTHFAHVAMSFIFSIYHWNGKNMWAALSGKSATRILWFTGFKACMNTIMVFSGFKKAGHFKFTPKSTVLAEESAVSAPLATFPQYSDSNPTPVSNVSMSDLKANYNDSVGVQVGKQPKKAAEFSDIHDALSKVSERRKMCMPMDGTFDFWVLLSTTMLTIASLAIGIVRLVQRRALLDWTDRNSLMWLGCIFALVDAAPGALYLGYMAVYDWAPGFLKVYCPLLVLFVSLSVVLIEIRMAIGFTFEI